MLKLEYLQSKKAEKPEKIQGIYMDMVKNISDGILFSGYKITEERLCEKYKTSRTPIREVLRKLESDGLIEIVKNRGAFVTGFTRASYLDMLKERKALEKVALDLAMDRIKEEELELLEENSNFIRFYYNTRDLQTLSKVFRGFHQILYYSTYNSRLESRMNFLLDCSNRKDVLAGFYDGYLDDLFGYYTSIFACFKDKNKEKALALMDKLMDLLISYQTNNFI
ncbi:MAG: GntR family transcriptional regulator [Clostridia bacterium]|nr:GntR family transcriptional regulator [Clostridia bacterium]